MKLAIRTKLTLWYIGTVVAMLGTFVGADVVGLRSNLLRHADDTLWQAADVIFRRIKSVPADWHRSQQRVEQAKGLLQQQLGADQAWAILQREAQGEAPLTVLTYASSTAMPYPAKWGQCPTAGAEDSLADYEMANVGRVRCLTATITDSGGNRYRLEAAVSIESAMVTWRHALWEHGILMVILVVVISVVGYVFIRRVFRPVHRIVQTARTITADDLSLRVDDRGDQDEIGELARTLNDMIARLEQSFTQVQRFSSDASHELNTPLSVLRGELEVALRRRRSTDEYHALLERLLEEVTRLSGIVDDLLFLSRADAQRLDKSAETVALDRVVLEAFEESANLAADREVTVELEQIDETAVRGDASLFKRAVSNLLDNAIKFTPAGGTVTISLTSVGHDTTLSITDTGCGIPDEDRARIFDRFYRADPSRSRQRGGVGLGLSLVREIVDLYGLELTIESQVDEGTRVAVAWPVSG